MGAREIDYAIAERVFGHTLKRAGDVSPWASYDLGADKDDRMVVYPNGDAEIVPSYSETWEGMGLVAEAMRAQRPTRWLQLQSYQYGFVARFVDPDSRKRVDWEQADTAPMAVCLAALRALESA